MIKLNQKQLTAIIAIISSEQSGAKSLVEKQVETTLSPERMLLFDFQQNVYYQYYADSVTYVGYMRENGDGEFFFIDARNQSQEYKLNA